MNKLPNLPKDIDPKLSAGFNALREVPPRESEKAAAGRAAFLAEAQKMAAAMPQRTQRRMNNWKQSLQSIFMLRKEHNPMFGTLATVIVVISLLLGGGGITVAAAQSALPDDALYSVKLWSEDVRLDLNTDPETEFELALEFANRRVDELISMMAKGETPDEAVQTKMGEQLDQAIMLAAKLGNGDAKEALTRLQDGYTVRIASLRELLDADTLLTLEEYCGTNIMWCIQYWYSDDATTEGDLTYIDPVTGLEVVVELPGLQDGILKRDRDVLELDKDIMKALATLNDHVNMAEQGKADPKGLLNKLNAIHNANGKSDNANSIDGFGEKHDENCVDDPTTIGNDCAMWGVGDVEGLDQEAYPMPSTAPGPGKKNGNGD